MRNTSANRRGSALLIVLGMLSFMIVSAVAFSVYMRTSRAPSSYLRRSVATQHLTKAALARAIEEIDDCIGNDPYPGVGQNATESRNHKAIDNWKYKGFEDKWPHRVFCPYADAGGDTNVERFDTDSTEEAGNSNNIGFSDTTAVLTLEGLGYIPAPLVNNVRYWSRRSATSRWKRFNYDLGRWAYTAVNVSDLFDINAVRAYTNRNSGAFGRISLASAAKKAGVDPQQLDAFLADPGGLPDKVPFVSVMDFNLAAGNNGILQSPFLNWIRNGGNNGFYGGVESSKIAPLMFVTDSWQPSTNQFAQSSAPSDDYYLSNPDDQPFRQFNNNSGFLEFFRVGNPAGAGDSFADLFAKHIRAVGCACLYDYLDNDSVPLSLALPCTEQVPMIIGMCPIVTGLGFTIKDKAQDNPKLHDQTIQIDSAAISVKTALVYPFKRVEDPGSFKVQALVRIYLGSDNMPLRVAGSNSPLHPQASHWSLAPNTLTLDAENSIYTMVSSPDATVVTPPDATSLAGGNEANIIIDVPLINMASGGTAEQDFFTWEETTPEPTTDNPNPAPVENVTAFNFRIYGRDGMPVGWSGNAFSGDIGRIIPNVAVWLRVMDADGKTVDLAPATLGDDNLNWSLGLSQEQSAIIGAGICGSGVPLFNFRTKSGGSPAYPIFGTTKADLISWAKNCAVAGGIGAGVSDSSLYSAIYCFDPRYNFAPEDWYATADLGIDAQKWLADVQGTLLGKDGRDTDVFMFVSNQEYLQSMGELAFLPRTQDLDMSKYPSGGEVLKGNFTERNPDADPYNGHDYDGFSRTFADEDSKNFGNGLAHAANRRFFWRTYRSYKQDDLAADPLFTLKDASGNRMFDDDGRGPRVNPYTDSTDLFMAALVNTPYDYSVASTNDDARAFPFSNISEGLKHCFNEDSPLAKVTDKDMERVAAVMSAAMKGEVSGEWEKAYDDLPWDEDGILGVEMNSTAINDVDRKFLYSFWRSCFGNRQQLFIVFVRAEPNVMGSAQQGGRAVAVVWRDPAPPAGYADRTSRRHEKSLDSQMNDMLPPHRTRILFYHQFD